MPSLVATRTGERKRNVNPERHHRVMQIFQDALDRSGQGREAYLKLACGNDRELRAEVESLLGHHDTRTIAPVRKLERGLTADRAKKGRRGAAALASPDPDFLRASLIAILLAILLAALGYLLNAGIESRLRKNLGAQLQATLDSNVAAVTNWLELQRYEVQEWAAHPQLRAGFPILVELAKSPDKSLDDLRQSEIHKALLDLVTPFVHRDDVIAVNATDTSGLLVFTSRRDRRERFQLSPTGSKLIAPVFIGQTVLLPPTRGQTLIQEEMPEDTHKPIILVGSPIQDNKDHTVGGLFVSIESGLEFTKLLDLGRAGEHGDTYAFGPQGQMLSASRYETQLKAIGLLNSDEPGASVLNVELRDPGVDLTAGQKIPASLAQRPLTAMAASAVTGTDGMNLDGYRDYRGVKVVGAWKWLDKYGFGVTTEIEYDEAYSVLNYVRRILGTVFGLLVVTAGLAYLSSLSVARLRREVGEARQLGQYTLEKLIGQGGMGRVYKARHALLRRPTAVKVLDGQEADKSAVARFEREVQLASSLTHPNTVEIFDYGRTPDDVFYFAMEYLPGITLDGLVRRDGAIGVARVLYILRQLLASLAEAHGRGLIHRDIKPANVILCERGGEVDFVKVVDFGLAKELAFDTAPQITQTGLISGTPLYIAPECLDDPNKSSPSSDIYAVGVVAFYLLTGRELFTGANALVVLQKVAHDPPPRSSDVVHEGIPPELDDLVYRCVSKNPAERPASVGEMLEVVQSLMKTYVWTQEDARRWWQAFESEPAHAGEHTRS